MRTVPRFFTVTNDHAGGRQTLDGENANDRHERWWMKLIGVFGAGAVYRSACRLTQVPSVEDKRVLRVTNPSRRRHSSTPQPEYEVVHITNRDGAGFVTDAQGNPVLGLKQTDFRIEEDGRPQEIAQVGDPEHVPLDIALLIDVSASVVARFDFEQAAAAAFLKQVLKSEDRATVFAIDQSPRMIQPLTNATAAAQSVMTVKAMKGYTAFYDSVLAAARMPRSIVAHRRRNRGHVSDGDRASLTLQWHSHAVGLVWLELMRNKVSLKSAGDQRGQRSEITFIRSTQRPIAEAECPGYAGRTRPGADCQRHRRRRVCAQRRS